MHLSQFHYLPLTPGFFSILVALFVGLLVIMVVIGALRHAYLSLGVSPGTAMLLLLGSLIGSYFNIPIAALPPEQVEVRQGDRILRHGIHRADGREPAGHGDRDQCRWRGHSDHHVDLSARQPALVGVGRHRHGHRRGRAALARQSGARRRHRRADIRAGLITAAVSLLLSRRDAAPLAYISGSMGTLIGADLTNLDKVAGLGAPVASIGGAGTFDGIFITGILAVLLAGLYRPRPQVAPL